MVFSFHFRRGERLEKNRSIAVFIVSSADNDLVLEESNRFLYKLDNEIDRISRKNISFFTRKSLFSSAEIA